MTAAVWEKDGVAYLYPPDENLTPRERFEIQEAEWAKWAAEFINSPEYQESTRQHLIWQRREIERIQAIDRRLGGGPIMDHWLWLAFNTLPFSLPDAGLTSYAPEFEPSPQFAELQYMLQRDERARVQLHALARELGRDYYQGPWWQIVRREHLRRQPFCVECFPGAIWAKELTQSGNKKLMSLWLCDEEPHLIDFQRWLPLQAHHSAYYNRDGVNIYGLEALNMEVLVTLCSKHHAENHGKTWSD